MVATQGWRDHGRMKLAIRPSTVVRQAERVWRAVLITAAATFAAAGPVHAVGMEALAKTMATAAMALVAVSVLCGLLGLRAGGAR